MKQWILPSTGPPSVFTLKKSALPKPSAKEVRVRVKASGVNFADLMARQGLYPDAPPFPFAPGYEVVLLLKIGFWNC